MPQFEARTLNSRDETFSAVFSCRRCIGLKIPELRNHLGRGMQGDARHCRRIPVLRGSTLAARNLRNSRNGVIQCLHQQALAISLLFIASSQKGADHNTG